MQAIWRRIPDRGTIARHRAKLAGFAAGVVVPIVAVLFFDALRTGEGLYETPDPDRAVIYPDL